MTSRVRNHKLAITPTSQSTWSLSWHFGLLCLCGYFHSLRMTCNEILWDKGLIQPAYGESTRYLTIWGQYLTYFYVFISFINDIAHLLDFNLKHRILLLIDYLFYPVCTITTVIGILFWTLHQVDPALLFPEETTPYYPMALNVFQHAGSGLILWLDAIICTKRVHGRTIHHLSTFALAFAYQSWTTFCYSVNGFHIYPFVEYLTPSQQVIFFILSLTIAFGVQSALIFVIETLTNPMDYKSKRIKP